MTGHERTYTLVLLGCLLLGTALNLALVPLLGDLGAAIFAAATLAVRGLVSLYVAWRRLGIAPSVWAGFGTRSCAPERRFEATP